MTLPLKGLWAGNFVGTLQHEDVAFASRRPKRRVLSSFPDSRSVFSSLGVIRNRTELDARRSFNFVSPKAIRLVEGQAVQA